MSIKLKNLSNISSFSTYRTWFPNVTNLVFRERALFFSWLSLVGFSLLCNFRQHRVATQECDDPDHDEVLEGGEHAHVEPEEVVQAEDGA